MFFIHIRDGVSHGEALVFFILRKCSYMKALTPVIRPRIWCLGSCPPVLDASYQATFTGSQMVVPTDLEWRYFQFLLWDLLFQVDR